MSGSADYLRVEDEEEKEQEEEVVKHKLEDPSKCTKPFVVCYILTAVFVAVCAIILLVLVVYPEASTQEVLLHQGDLVFVTVSPPWLSSLSASVKDTPCEGGVDADIQCEGDVYFNIPLDDLTNLRSHNCSYNPRDFKPEGDGNKYIYVLGNSTFYVQLDEPDVDQNISVWAVDDPCLYDKVVHNQPNALDKIDCQDYQSLPGNSICRIWNASQSNVSLPTPSKLETHNGTYYFLLTQPWVPFHYTVDRFYYETSKFEKYRKHIYTYDSNNIPLQDNFEPYRIFTPKTYVLFNLITCGADNSAGIMNVVPTRSYDFLVWPAIPAMLVLLIVVVVVFGHVHSFQRKREASRVGRVLEQH